MLLEDWYGGIRDDIDPIENAIASDFTAVDSDGRVHTGERALAPIRGPRAEYLDSQPPVAVEIDELVHHRTIYGIHHLTYVKRVRVDGEWTTCRCSLWLRETDRVPTGLQWLHYHETPLSEDVSEE